MDFRSQLSAFQGGGGAAGGGGSQGRGGNNPSAQRSPQRGYGITNNANNNNNKSSYGPGGRGDDRRRTRDYSPQSRGPPQQRRRVDESDRDGLGDLRHHRYRIPRGHPTPPTEEEKKERPKHLALLLLCIDELPYEHIWKEWCNTLNSSSECHISLVCHAKYPQQVKSEWLRQRLLVYPPKPGRGNSYLDPEYLSRVPNWGSVELTRAMLDLLSAGLKIGNMSENDPRFTPDRFVIHGPSGDVKVPPVDQFLYISETCLPVATAQEFFDVMDNTVSWVNARHRKDEGTPKNAYEGDQFSLINRKIPGQYRWKADQWVLLCRNQASQIMGIDRPHIVHKYHLWRSYAEINASDEMYIPTTLALLGFLRFTTTGEDTQRLRGIATNDKGDKPSAEPATPQNTFEFVKKRPVTYTDWSQGARNPATFAKGMADFRKVSRLARARGCLVARKFAPLIIVPGMDKNSLEITGLISATEWRSEVDILKGEFRGKETEVKSETPDEGVDHLPQEAMSNPDIEGVEASVQGGDEESSFLGGGAASAYVGNNVKVNDDDDDEEDEENQL